MNTTMQIGDKVYISMDITEPPDEHSPGGLLAKAGELVTIVNYIEGNLHPYLVDSKGELFSVKRSELMWTKPMEFNL